MGGIAPVSSRCPDCGKGLGPPAADLRCPGCGRGFDAAGGVLDLRPARLDAEAASEDRLHATAGPPTWRRLFFHKRYWLEWCEQRWLPEVLVPGVRTFLEIGGGLCYASALAKLRRPDVWVVATDVSPRYLRAHALETGRILGARADLYAAADAGRLPFEDGQFDAVYSQMVLYRLPDPARALGEIRRVLAPGGRWLGIERAWPWAWPFSRRNRRILQRAEDWGLAEFPMRWRDWRRLLRDAGVDATLAPVPGRRVRSAALRRAGNAARPIYVRLTLGG